MINEDAKLTNETTEESVAKPYTLRRLKDADLWPVLAIIAAVFPDDLGKDVLKIASGETKVKEAGVGMFIRIIKAVLQNMDKVHDEVYALLSDVSGIPADEIKEMEFGTTPMMIWDIFNNEKNAGFFKVVSKLQ